MPGSTPIKPISIQDLKDLVGTTLGPTEWHDITQERINAFADLTGDHQWIHVDPERANASDFGSTIAHGLYSLSVGPRFMEDLMAFDGFAHSLNYGYEKVRFPAPLPVGSRIRMHAEITSVDDVGGGSAHIVTTQKFEREGADKPICVAQSVGRFTEYPAGILSVPVTARRVHLAARPHGLPDESTWSIREAELEPPTEDEVLVQVSHLSLDPAMRGWLNDVRSYVPPVGVGEVMRAVGIGTVTESRHPDFAPGDTVSGLVGAADHAVLAGSELSRVDLSIAPATTWLGALGMPGMTAWFGLFDVARARPGDTVVVSGAAGAVGSIVGQLAKAHGSTVIGIAGGPDKCAWLTDELGFDAAVDHRQGPVHRGLRAAAPEGIDVYFDNVGGDMLDSALRTLRRGARVAICGAISTYNATEPLPGPAHYMSLLVNRASMAGFLVFDYEDRYPEAIEDIAGRIANGSLVAREHEVTGGIDAFGDALLMLFSGANTGKLVLTL